MRYLRRLVLLGTLSLMLTGGFEAPAFAKFVPRVGVEPAERGTAYITINNRKAIHLRTYNGNLSPTRRANIAAGRLAALMPKGIEPKSIWYKDVGRRSYVMVGKIMIVIATSEEARTRGMAPSKLAAVWVRNLRKLIAMPPLTAEPAALTVPLGETRTLTVESLLPGRVTAEISDGAVIKADPAVITGSLVVRGLSVGKAVIKIHCEDQELTVEAAVKKYAASFPGMVRAAITGYDPPVSLVKRVASDAARSAVLLEPGASVTRIQLPDVTRAPSPGRRTRLTVRVEAAGSDYIRTRLDAPVEIENRAIGPAPTSQIMYSNFPESIEKYQVLFTGRLNASQEATRLLYHHQNTMGRRIGFVVDVVNVSAVPASLHVIEGIAEPMLDTVRVGYKAGSRFLRCYRYQIGRIVELPPRTRRVIVSQPLDSRRTASGIVEFRQLSGEPLLVRAIAEPEVQRLDADPPDTTLDALGFDSLKLRMSDHIYPHPSKLLEVTYTVGKPWVFLRIGKYHLKHATLEKQLYGNYGVIYEIKATVENPTSVAQTVELVFEATAGEVSGVFIIGSKFVEITRLRPPGEKVIDRFVVPAGRTRTVSIRTMPLSGSAYPATLIIRSDNKARAMLSHN